jgi:hypothetical protein
MHQDLLPVLLHDEREGLQDPGRVKEGLGKCLDPLDPKPFLGDF